MEFSELVRSRRSHRAFTATPVTEEQIAALLEAGSWAPSPLNLQPWAFVVTTAPDLISKIRQIGEAARQRVLDAGGPGWVAKYAMDFVDTAPLAVTVLYDAKKGGLGAFFGQPHGALQAASACVQNIMLRAAELDLSSLWFTFFDPADLRPVLGIPESLDVAGTLLIGHPAAEAKAPPRKAPVVHGETYQAKAE